MSGETNLKTLLLVLSLVGVEATSCAGQIRHLGHLDRRARNCAGGGNRDNLITDQYLDESWYSVHDSGKQYLMPDAGKKPDFKTCGSLNVIYVNGTCPDINTLTTTPVDVTACLNDGFSDCDKALSIKMRKCGSDIQYYLAHTPSSSAYCFDPPELQTVQAFSPPPKSINLSHIEVKPELQFDKESSGSRSRYSPRLEFVCSFNWQPSYLYEVFWFVHGTQLISYGLLTTYNQTSAILHEKTLLDNSIKIGFMISCGVRVRGDLHGMATPIYKSRELYAGIKLVDSQIFVNKSSTGTLRLQLTVPLGCRYVSDTDPCFVDLQMFDPDGYTCNAGQLVELKYSRKCGQHLQIYDIEQALKKDDVWNPSRVFTFNVTTVDKAYNDAHVFKMAWRVTSDTDHVIWKNYQPDYATVIVDDTERYQSKICYAHVDPHMRTGDGYYYEHQFPGTFILYRNTKYNIEVQMKLAVCNGHVYCACGVAIMAGADVFILNRCDDNPFSEFRSCGDGGILRVVESSNKFEIYTPIGTKITLILKDGFYDNLMNIDITMSPKDLHHTEGLCGNFDGEDYKNDLIRRDGTIDTTNVNRKYINTHTLFSKSWKVTPAEDLFTSPLNRQLNNWIENNPYYCVCAKAKVGTGTPTASENITTEAVCEPSQYASCPTYKDYTNKKCHKFTNRKRSLHLKHAREIERLLRLSSDASEASVFSIKRRDVPAAQMTQSEAKSLCNNAIQGSLAVREFSNHTAGESPAAVIEQCTFDVKIGNDARLADVHVESLNNIVKTMFEKDVDYVQNNTDHVQYFNENTCPNNCSNVGTCTKEGTCVCMEHYHGADCAIDDRHPVEIRDMEGGGLCNLTDGDDCTCFYFRTLNLLPNFSCNVSGVMTYVSNETTTIPASVGTGEQEDIFTGICCVPLKSRVRRSTRTDSLFTTQYDISVSNDGVHFGVAQSMLVYDSTCQELRHEANQVFVDLIDGFCFIESQCVQNGTSKVLDQKSICLINTDKFTWTRVDDVEKSNANMNLILGLTIGLTVGLAVAALVALVIKTKVAPRLRSRKSVGDSFMQMKSG